MTEYDRGFVAGQWTTIAFFLIGYVLAWFTTKLSDRFYWSRP